MTTIKDSGTRRKFETGAVRDMQEGKGRMDLLPWCAIMRVARHFEAGAVKYGDRNWERGIPLASFMDSAARHIAKYMDGQTDEDHLCAAAWNLLCALWTEEKRPDLINIPTRPEYAGGAQYGLENEDEMVEKSSSSLSIKEDGIEIRNSNGDMVAKLDSTNGGWPQVFEIDDQEPEELKKPDWPKEFNPEPPRGGSCVQDK